MHNLKALKIIRSVAFLLLVFILLPVQAGPEIQHWETKNGMRVYFVPAKELPMVDIRVTFAAGSARDQDNAGIASFTNAMMAQGSAGMDTDAIAQAFEDIGANFSRGAMRDMAWFSLRTLSQPEYIVAALDTFAKVLWHPDFPNKDLERARKQVLLGLKAGEADPATIASKAWYKALYGDHPYASPVSGAQPTVEKFERQQLQDFYEKYYVAHNGLIAMTGDIDRARAEKVAEVLSAGLKSGEPAPALPKVKPLEEGQEIKIPFPSKQAHVMIGQPGIERGNPDYYALYLGNHVLGGGGFTSRLVKEVRVKRGYAYSVYSYFMLMQEPGPLLIGLQTRGSQAEDAVKVSRETLESFMKTGPDDGEITASKRNITGGFPIRIASNRDIVEYLGLIGFYNLPLDYLDTFTGNIDEVEKQQIIDAYAKHVHPDKMITVTVGGEDT